MNTPELRPVGPMIGPSPDDHTQTQGVLGGATRRPGIPGPRQWVSTTTGHLFQIHLTYGYRIQAISGDLATGTGFANAGLARTAADRVARAFVRAYGLDSVDADVFLERGLWDYYNQREGIRPLSNFWDWRPQRRTWTYETA